MITMEYISESLGESLHTALRKICESNETHLFHGIISEYPNAWMLYVDIVRELLPSMAPENVSDKLKLARRKFVIRHSDDLNMQAFSASLQSLTTDDYDGMSGYLISDLKGLMEKPLPTLVGCDTIDKAIAFACTYETLEEALSWVCTWEHEHALKRESTDTCFTFATKEVVAHYKEKDTKFIAFWKYDKYPFLLSSEVVEFLSDGNVKTKQYKGMVMVPTHILVKPLGDKYASALRDLTEERVIAQQNLNKTFNDKLEVINKEYVK